MNILDVRGLTAGYGAQDVLFDVGARIDAGEIVAVISPNGAGKTTLLKTIAGILRPRTGDILYRNESLLNRTPRAITSRGISWVPQEDNVFPSMTVRENLEMGAFLVRGGIEDRIEEVYGIFPQLAERMGRHAGSLSGDQRQMLAVGRGLMIRPDLQLLDEPTAGLAPNLVQLMLDRIRKITQALNCAVLLVIQTFDAVRLSDRGYLLSAGVIRCEDRTERFVANQEVKDLYIGG